MLRKQLSPFVARIGIKAIEVDCVYSFILIRF